MRLLYRTSVLLLIGCNPSPNPSDPYADEVVPNPRLPEAPTTPTAITAEHEIALDAPVVTCPHRPAASIARPQNGMIQVSFEQGTPGIVYTVQFSSDLRSWLDLRHAPADAQGRFSITDTANAPQRFYRASA